MTEIIAELEDARLAYPGAGGEVSVLAGIDMRVTAGEILAVTGPSGSGKSSLIALMGGLERPTGGRIDVMGVDMAHADETTRTRLRRRDIGVVFQAYHLVPAMTALQNVALPLVLAGIPDARERAAAMLDRVGLGHRLDHRPTALSGGEQQRAAIARAFIAAPRLILADEPTGNLDQKTGAAIVEVMFDLARSTGAALLLVTHDPALAARCDRRLEIDSGRIAA
ncbi:ABC transporter ATP-binding protein [Marivibrio halodurans]|uniref:ABC transporter ATP-binding protein n=1 Tax=Marivibrio halodurans TaxID=2039722 RepID=UPI001FE3812C|nr:ABC transporter ATP-binding protein [Marivibrio halodurans]